MNPISRLFRRSPVKNEWDYKEGGWVTNGDTAPSTWSSVSHAIDFGLPQSPDSASIADFARRAGNSVSANLMQAATAESKELSDLYANEYIDSRMLAMMRAVEWFTRRRGDLWQIMTAPLDIGLQRPVIRHADDGVRRTYMDEYERLGVHELLGEIWLACEEYGQAYPVIIPERVGNKTKGVVGLTMLNPKHVAVGRAVGSSFRTMSFTPPKETRQALLDTVKEHGRRSDEDMFLNTLLDGWNEWIEDSRGFRLNAEYVTHVHHRKHRHQRYAIPPAARALDDLSSRLVLDEMIRSTIEGVHTQWRVWRMENPKPGEVTRFSSLLGANRSQRTADLVWDAKLQPPTVVMPESIDELLASEAWWKFTLSIYRQMGMFIRIVSGEDPSQGGRSEADIDVQLLIARLTYQQERTLVWLRLLNRHLATIHKIKEEPVVSFAPIQPQWEAKLRGVVPLLNYGLLSLATVHSWIGVDTDEEVKRLKKEKPLRDAGIIAPYTGFAQSGPSGTTEHRASPGRPVMPSPQTSETNRENAKSVKSRLNAILASEADYERETLEEFDLLARDIDQEDTETRRARVGALIAVLISLRAHRTMAFEQGYIDAGGVGPFDAAGSPRYLEAVSFDDENLARFRDDLLGRLDGSIFTKADRLRASQYATAGWRVAYMAGVFDVKERQGFTGWQRVLNWAGSTAGPCQDCIADSNVIHPISELFWDHPNGVCDAKYVMFSRTGEVLPLPFRVPTYMPVRTG